MQVFAVQSKIKAENVADVDAVVGRMFAAIEREQPGGIRYASLRLPDGVTYVAVLEVDDGVTNPLPALPEFREFQDNLKAWVAEPPDPANAAPAGAARSHASPARSNGYSHVRETSRRP